MYTYIMIYVFTDSLHREMYAHTHIYIYILSRAMITRGNFHSKHEWNTHVITMRAMTNLVSYLSQYGWALKVKVLSGSMMVLRGGDSARDWARHVMGQDMFQKGAGDT